MRKLLPRFLALGTALLFSLPASAESGKLNLNLDLGIGAPLSGRYGSEINSTGAGQSYGPHLLAAIDYQVAAPLALELAGGLGVQFVPPNVTHRATGKSEYLVVPAWFVGFGPRFRFLDDSTGYADDKGGDTAGNLWASLHAGIHGFEGLQFGIDAALGYQWNGSKPFNIGPFLRGTVLAPNATASRGTTFLLTVGAAATWELVPMKEPPPPDSDNDGLTDDMETTTYKTNPLKADTDDDGLNDALEVNNTTDPLRGDTDGDSILDGREDANQNGKVDGAETDPRIVDTDKDGLPDGIEDANHNGRHDRRETDATLADTDGDGLKDGIEDDNHNGKFDAGETDPLNVDTDGDGLRDGDEDANHNGRLDAGETDPRVAEVKAPPPPPDRDADGVIDDLDNCPTEAGPASNQGCPEAKKQLVVITKEKLTILDKVYFDTAKATIQKKSFLLLDQIAEVLNSHPAITLIQVEGHTDNVGNADKNLKLSQARAESVTTYLVGKKVDAARLKPVGFGQTRPADVNTTPAGRDNNRRVEFNIIAQ